MIATLYFMIMCIVEGEMCIVKGGMRSYDYASTVFLLVRHMSHMPHSGASCSPK